MSTQKSIITTNQIVTIFLGLQESYNYKFLPIHLHTKHENKTDAPAI